MLNDLISAANELNRPEKVIAKYGYRPLGDPVEVSVISSPGGLRFANLPESSVGRALANLKIEGQITSAHGPSAIDWLISECVQNLATLYAMRALCTALPATPEFSPPLPEDPPT